MAMAQVQSANIVGYQQITLDQKYTILGINFTAVDGSNISLQDAVPYATGMTKANVDSAADQIQIQNAAGTYDIYYLSNGYNAKGNAVSGLDGKWAAAGKYVVSDATLAPGTAFWFVRKDATSPITINIAGGVSMIASNSKGIDGTYKLIANPYPTALPLNDGIPYVAGMTKANVDSAADQIQIQNAAGTYDIYYLSNGYNAKGNAVSGLDGKWAAAGKYVVADASIPAGKGAWFVRKGSTDFDITIARPYTIE